MGYNMRQFQDGTYLLKDYPPANATKLRTKKWDVELAFYDNWRPEWETCDVCENELGKRNNWYYFRQYSDDMTSSGEYFKTCTKCAATLLTGAQKSSTFAMVAQKPGPKNTDLIGITWGRKPVNFDQELYR